MGDHPVCYFNGAFILLADAKIGIMTHAFNYGTACFEGIRAYWSAEDRQFYTFRIRDHFERLRRSSGLLMIDLPHSVDELCDITQELLYRNQFETDIYARPLVYKSSEAVGVRLHDLDAGFAIFAVPFGDYIEASGGIRAMVSSWRRIDDNAAPSRAKLTGTYVNAALAKSEAVLNGFDEAIMLTDDGHVCEGSAENIFLVSGGELITPLVSDNILVGITRSTVIQLARDDLHLVVRERRVDRSELYSADEVFLCGTGAQIIPVVEIDHRPIGNGEVGPITARVARCYDDVVHGVESRYHSWLSAVYQREPSRR
ncbi:branched-chain amino acid transaminase [Nitrolancea hollandica]|uniref:Branched-chain-amino-acid aminotransferase n=1 Tax=Nitrolancea hollandica Lb TaxID=1129897 RepID=I4EDL2_9BACT|nr:branched-chain amino acid transaminase [Nitrolancea hollandica]CCF82774.1 putative branched-chain-amino-acid aminotransferase [Nitrolancea hollandica Lb]